MTPGGSIGTDTTTIQVEEMQFTSVEILGFDPQAVFLRHLDLAINDITTYRGTN